MTLSPIGGLTVGQQNADTQAVATPEQRKVAKDFEAIFMRQLLSSMEKTGGMGASGSGAAGGASVYRSMMVGAVADSAAEGGGIGLAEIILESMLRASGTPAKPEAPTSASGASQSATPVASADASGVTPAGESVPQQQPSGFAPKLQKDVTSSGTAAGLEAARVGGPEPLE